MTHLQVDELVPRAARLARCRHGLRRRGLASADVPEERLRTCMEPSDGP